MSEMLTGDYLGMPLAVDAGDHANQAFFRACSQGVFKVQKCGACALLWYPPSTGCPHCGAAEFDWVAVEGRGTLYTYAVVPHAIQPSFRDHTPYLIAIVELDTQSGVPNADDGIRVAGNLVNTDGELASPNDIALIGIGSRMKMTFRSMGDGFAMPMWTLDQDAEQPDTVWRYPKASSSGPSG